jgi:hypothetical protein
MRHHTNHANDPRRRAARSGWAFAAAGLLAVGLLTSACSGGGIAGGDPEASALAYARCMRSHGLPSFPDPVFGPNGSVAIKFGKLGPNSPQVQRAEQACKSIIPPVNGASQAIPPAQQALYLKWAACIRAHGLHDFPDPTFDASGLHMNITRQNVPDRTLLQSALTACNHDLAGVPGGSPVSVGNG